MTTSRRLKILCLHGYTQNAEVFSKKTSAWRKACEGFADFVYVSAPHTAIPSTDGGAYVPGAATDSERVWYIVKAEGTLIYDKLEASLEYLAQVLENEGPFDGIIGFSQGAATAGILSALLEGSQPLTEKCLHPPFRFGIFIGGYLPAAPKYSPLFATPLSMPSLHLIGRYDTVVSIEKSEALSKGFRNSTSLYHDGG
ncbi:hypothetical protein K493DRAFT_410818 [Basidiobolus meristosporus CBS 931.73]|uniref:Serine hydrolase domain-containing protein n=1 Tax=Basidiobolus meristosporus CBS 931.73 TaxID=1314790 RepID=A0A1Y1XSU8_9FUNG|nr:hypothetical protein K493DRAFT_410818 [Basidiobolus meristosporus CBS 931.73]|eukprot:ORX88808.1 hypothetical protein K493DRAFT_410818 [Basidiobolus meristosporus CBS 931.73]